MLVCQHFLAGKLLLIKGAFTYDVRFLGRQVGQTESDFTKQAYVVKYLIRVGRQVKNAQKSFDVMCECSPRHVRVLNFAVEGILQEKKNVAF